MPESDEITRRAEAVRAAGVPDSLNRFLTITKEQWEMAKTMGPKERQLRDLKASRRARGLERGAKDAQMTTLRAMVKAVDDPKKSPNLDQALALAQGRTLDAAVLGSGPLCGIVDSSTIKETGTWDVKTNLAAQAKKDAAAKAATKTPKASAPAIQQETTMKTKTKVKPLTAKQRGKSANTSTTRAKKADARARKTESARTPLNIVITGNETSVAKAAGKLKGDRPDGLRSGSKQAIMLDLALRDEGATEALICSKLGWKKCRVTLKRVCDKVGATLRSEKNVKQETVWFATMPKRSS